jgi:CheY-like chemotaxis protein
VEQNPTILLIEDSEDDVLLFRRALELSGLPFFVQNVPSCQLALDYLTAQGSYENRQSFPFPRLIIADNCVGQLSTTDFLRVVRRYPDCGLVPIVILSGSAPPRLVESSYQLGAHSFFEKPATFAEFQALLKLILDYWTRARLPPNRPDLCAGSPVGR